MDAPVAVQLIELLRGAVNRGTGQGIRSAWGHHGRRGGQDRHHAEQHRRLVHP